MSYSNHHVDVKDFDVITDRENGADDVTIKILYCGICHSDLHNAKNEWGFTKYPVVPGYGLRYHHFVTTLYFIIVQNFCSTIILFGKYCTILSHIGIDNPLESQNQI